MFFNKTKVFLFNNTLFLQLLLLLFQNENIQAEKKYSFASANVSQTHVGETIALRCDVDKGVWDNEQTYIFFKLGSDEFDIALYLIGM